jgi:cell division protein ZapA (FtsZ GTPase activity inhibitor)
MSTLTIRLTPAEEKLVDQLKDHYCQTASSKALIMAAQMIMTEYKPLMLECKNLQKEVDRQRNIILGLKNHFRTIRESEDEIKSILFGDSSTRRDPG